MFAASTLIVISTVAVSGRNLQIILHYQQLSCGQIRQKIVIIYKISSSHTQVCMKVIVGSRKLCVL